MSDKPRMLKLANLRTIQREGKEPMLCGSLMLDRLAQAAIFSDKYKKEKISIIIFQNTRKETDKDPDFCIFAGNPPPGATIVREESIQAVTIDPEGPPEPKPAPPPEVKEKKPFKF